MHKAEILVAEDEAYLRDYLSALLRSSGYKVVSAATGAEACDLVDAGLRPCLLFTDFYMASSMDGVALAETVRLVLPTVAVVFTSGDPEICERILLPAGAQFLPKPFRRLQCLDAVELALGKA